MIRPLKLKPDFDKTIERFESWWVGQILDRPPITLSVKPLRPYSGPTKSHATFRDRWLDVEFAVESAAAELERREYLADSYPMFFPNVGPELCATVLGCELEFSETTSWAIPMVRCVEEWRQVLALKPNYQNVYWQTIWKMIDYGIDRSDGRFTVGVPDLHGNYDLLASLRDPQDLCVDMIDCPELIREAGHWAADLYVEQFDRLYKKLASAGFGTMTWCRFCHDGPAYVPSCDFWCMVSPGMAREMILPDIVREMAPLERSIFHLDGPGALPHLDLLLALPELNAVQWIYGTGNEPASRWIDVYRRVRQAGKSVQVCAVDAKDALAVLEAIGPEGTWLEIGEEFATAEEAERFIKQVEKCSRRGGSRRRS